MTRIPGARHFVQVVVMIGASLLVFGGVAIAQQPGKKGGPQAQGQGMGHPPERGMGRHGGPGPRDLDRTMSHLTERLSLNEEQQKQIRQIFEEREAKAREMMAKSRESGASREERRKQFAGFRQETQAKVEAVLNEKQAEQYRQMQAERRQMMEKRREQRAEQGMGTGRRGPQGMMGGSKGATPAEPAKPAEPSQKSTDEGEKD